MTPNFTVRFLLGTVKRILISDESDYTGVASAYGFYRFEYPDGVFFENTDSLNPDFTDTQSESEFNLRSLMTGTYKVTQKIVTDIGEFELQKTFQVTWVEPVLAMTNTSNIITPIVSFLDTTNYSVANYSQSITRQITVEFPTNVPFGTRTTVNQEIQMSDGGNYYEGKYYPNLSVDVVYGGTDHEIQWIANKDFFFDIRRLQWYSDLIEILDGMYQRVQDSKGGQAERLKNLYNTAVSLYSHIIGKYSLGVSDVDDLVKDLLKISEESCCNCDSVTAYVYSDQPLPAYDPDTLQRFPFIDEVRYREWSPSITFSTTSTIFHRVGGRIRWFKSKQNNNLNNPIFVDGSIDSDWWEEILLGEEQVLFLPDGVVTKGILVQDGNDITLNTEWSWRIDNVVYSLGSDTELTFPNASVANHRIDLIVGDENGEIQRVAGTQAAVTSPVFPPSAPVGTVSLVEVLVLDAGVDDLQELTFASFVRFDANDQGLTTLQRQNARTNIQALSRDTNDSRTGSLTNNGNAVINGTVTVNAATGITVNTGEDGSASSNMLTLQNTLAGGVFVQRRGSVRIRARGDSVTDYFIVRLQGSANGQATVFEVGQNGATNIGLLANLPLSGLLRVGGIGSFNGVVKHANAIAPEDSATLGQLNAVQASLISLINDISAGESFRGSWNASTNTPTLASGVGTAGHYYQVTVAGTTNIDGINDWELGDEILFNGTVWTKRESFGIISVNSKVGSAITLNQDDILDGSTYKQYSQAEKTKLGFISVTQAVDLDQIESDTATNNAKVSNATHTGEVTGDTVLTIANDAVKTPKIENGAVTLAKQANVSSGTVFYRKTAGAGAPEVQTLSTLRTDLDIKEVVVVSVPGSNTSAGQRGHIALDSEFTYFYVGDGTTHSWKRIAFDLSY